MTIAEPIFLRNLTLYPVLSASTNGLDVASADEGLKDGSCAFRELDTPLIDEIEFDNGGDSPVLLLDGEEITGSLQNRILAASTVVEGRSRETIGVVCAEEGRWSELGLFSAGSCSYPALRALLSRHRRKAETIQQTVWTEIERKLTATQTLSQTSSMHDIYNNLQDEVDRYVEGFEGLNGSTSGFIAVAAGKILGCDIFESPAIYKKYENKLLRSYALDAIEHRSPVRAECDVDGFLVRLTRASARRSRAGATGRFSFSSGGISGQGVVLQDRTAHLSAFPK